MEFGGWTQRGSDGEGAAARRWLRAAALAPNFDDLRPQEARFVWAVRESGLGAAGHVPGKPLDVGRVGGRGGARRRSSAAICATARAARALRIRRRFLRTLRRRLRAHAHELRSRRRSRAFAKFRAFIDEAADLVASYGGSFSGEHGDGQARAALLEKMFGPELMGAFREFKRSGIRTGR